MDEEMQFSEEHPDHYFKRVDEYLKWQGFEGTSAGKYKRSGETGNGKTIQNTLWDALKQEVGETNSVARFAAVVAGSRIRNSD
jgi:hypothetical protein